MSASRRDRVRSIGPAGSRAAKVVGRAQRLWLGSLEEQLWTRLPISYRVQAHCRRVYLTPVFAGEPVGPGVVVAHAHGASSRRYLYLGPCRRTLIEAGLGEPEGAWVRLLFDRDGLLLSAIEGLTSDAVVSQVQRLRGDGRLWLGCLAALGVAYRRFVVSGDRYGVYLTPTPHARGLDALQVRGEGRLRYVYLSGARTRALLDQAGMLGPRGVWVRVEASVHGITLRRAWDAGARAPRRSRP